MLKKTPCQMVVAVLLAVLMVSGSATAFAAMPETVEPMYTGILSVRPEIKIGHLGEISCTDTVSVRSGYTASVTWELQYGQNGNWAKNMTWEKSGTGNISLKTTRYAMSGFSYRLKTTVKVYNAKGTLVESPVKYSTVVSY